MYFSKGKFENNEWIDNGELRKLDCSTKELGKIDNMNRIANLIVEIFKNQ